MRDFSALQIDSKTQFLTAVNNFDSGLYDFIKIQ